MVSCSCSNSVRTKCTPAQGAVSPSQNVVGDRRRQEGSTSSRADMYKWAKIRIPEFRGGDKWSSYLVQFRTIMKMHGVLLCYSLLYYVYLLCSRNNDQKRVYRIKQCVTFIQYFLN